MFHRDVRLNSVRVPFRFWKLKFFRYVEDDIFVNRESPISSLNIFAFHFICRTHKPQGSYNNQEECSTYSVFPLYLCFADFRAIHDASSGGFVKFVDFTIDLSEIC